MKNLDFLLLSCVIWMIFAAAVYHRKSQARVKNSLKEMERDSPDFYVVVEKPEILTYPRVQAAHLYDEELPLKKIKCRVGTNFRIPNVIHYVWFGKWKINRLHYISIRSAAVIQRPEKIVFHLDDAPPIGVYWERLKSEIPCLEMINATKPEYIFGRKIRDIEHKSDVERMRILLEEGGIYADVNLLFVQPFDRLMDKSFVIGKEDDRTYGNAILLSEPHAPFMELWHQTYYTFDFGNWGEHSTEMPKRLHEAYPDLPIHVEKYSIMRPNYDDDFALMSRTNWDLRYNYCVHIYVHDPHVVEWLPAVLEMPFSQVITFDNTFGQLIRLALFGTPYLTLEDIDEQIYKSHTGIKCGAKTSEEPGKIPKLLHYVWDEGKMMFHNYLSIRSAVQSIKPEKVLLHLLQESDPLYYRYLQLWREIPCLEIKSASGIYKKVKYLKRNPVVQNFAARLMILEKYGGIAPANDTIIHTNIDNMLYFEAVVNENAPVHFIMAQKDSVYIKEWIDKLKNYEQVEEHGLPLELLVMQTKRPGVRLVSNFIQDDDLKRIKTQYQYHGISLNKFLLPDYTDERELIYNGPNSLGRITKGILKL